VQTERPVAAFDDGLHGSSGPDSFARTRIRRTFARFGQRPRQSGFHRAQRRFALSPDGRRNIRKAEHAASHRGRTAVAGGNKTPGRHRLRPRFGAENDGAIGDRQRHARRRFRARNEVRPQTQYHLSPKRRSLSRRRRIPRSRKENERGMKSPTFSQRSLTATRTTSDVLQLPLASASGPKCKRIPALAELFGLKPD